jgi:uncharacterized protein YodC (DUF2158 family)
MAEKHTFKIGDQVELISGGPTMTVTSELEDHRSTGHVYCSWFSGKKHEQGQFPTGALKPVPTEPADGKK